jgi:predicted membrane protein
MQIPDNFLVYFVISILGIIIGYLLERNYRLTKYIMHKESPDTFYALNTPKRDLKPDIMKSDETIRNQFFETIIKGEATDDDIKTFGEVENVIQ